MIKMQRSIFCIIYNQGKEDTEPRKGKYPEEETFKKKNKLFI